MSNADEKLDKILSDVSEIKVCVARIDERQTAQHERVDTLEKRFDTRDWQTWIAAVCLPPVTILLNWIRLRLFTH